jgi:DNA recombination protein RmuC
MFLPADIFLSSALEYDRSLLEFSMREKIVIATPGTLFALLSTIALVWRRQNITENAEQMMKLGQELYKRLADAAQHISDLGKSINSTVSAYNQTVAGFENRVFVTARKFKNLEIHEKDIVEPKIIDKSARVPALELTD